jgi:hydroxyacylglutathione hydrolase
MSDGGRRLRVEVIETPELGDRSYLVHDGEDAFVIDPQRDLDRVSSELDRLGVRLAVVGETHIHNDYLSGGLALARDHDVPYLVAASEPVDFDRTAVSDDETFRVGSLSVHVVATPGHTPGHVAFVVTAPGQAPALFTGGSLLYGSVGRTDLYDAEQAERYARLQYRSVRSLVTDLPDETAVFPTHGFGSFCSAAPAMQRTSSTIGDERRLNEVLRGDDETTSARRQLENLMPFPAYYQRMAPRNRRGASAADLSAPPEMAPSDLQQRLADREWVVDIRSRREFAADHIAGTLNFELSRPFATYLGWLFPYGNPLTLLGENRHDIAAAQRQLVRIGIDDVSAGVGSITEIAGDTARHGSYPVVGFSELAHTSPPSGALILDVRHDAELKAGTIKGSHHLPLATLIDDPSRLPAGPVWVHCASGFRASIAASVLSRAGRDVVLIDDDFSNAVDIGLAA